MHYPKDLVAAAGPFTTGPMPVGAIDEIPWDAIAQSVSPACRSRLIEPTPRRVPVPDARRRPASALCWRPC